MATTIQFRRGLAAEWQSVNPVLAQGEMGLELDTNKAKIGNGVLNWNDLPYSGIVGPQGPQGIQGIQGEIGPVGPQGPQGPQGIEGAPGVGITLKGSVANVVDLPTTGNSAGDAYIVDSEGDLYVWTGTLWDNVGQIVGPQGPQGPQGIQGPVGPQGPQGESGENAAPPSNDPYSSSWNGVTGVAPSKNAVYDEIELAKGRITAVEDAVAIQGIAGNISYDNSSSALTATNVQDAIDEVVSSISSMPSGTTVSDIAYSSSWNGVTDVAPSKNAVYDEMELAKNRITAVEDLLIAQTIWVSKNGNDTTGNGGQHKPFLTINKALSTIIDASPSKRYVVRVAAGAYTETAIALPANVFIIGESKESVRISGPVSMGSWTQDNSGSDDRSGFSMVALLGAADFNWSTVKSRAGKLYMNEVVFGSTLNMYGYDNAIAQAQFDSCLMFGAITISGINVGVFSNNVCSANITLNQHPNGGMATILAATGGQCGATVTLNASVNDFNRRCSLFAKNFYMEYVSINGPSSYADMNDASLPRSRDRISSSNGGNLVPISTKAPLVNNNQNIGEPGYQYLYNFSYVYASSDTDLYLISMGSDYVPAATGRSIFIESDSYGLNNNVNGGDINLTTALTSGTGVRGKIKLDGREIDVSSKKIINVANGIASNDAVNKSQLDDHINDTSDAHDASAISVVPSGNLAADDVQEALQELQGSIDSINNSVGALNGIASLDSAGKIPSSQIPSIAITDVHVVANIAARDALVVEEGDVAKVLDAGDGIVKTYIRGNTAWVEIEAGGTGAVESVNGQVGIVNLDSDDVPEGISNEYFTVSKAKAAAVNNTAYGASWHGINDVAPSKNAVHDIIQSILSTETSASNVSYSNTVSGLTATNVQDALDEIVSQGIVGKSAYEVAVDNGFVGTEAQWLASLVGATGPIGPAGPAGPAGTNGVDGKSAYEVAVDNGFVGTEAQWLASLVGATGTSGTNGVDGASAYEVAVDNGFVGTEAQWLASLVGATGTSGTNGADGASAYEVAVDNGFTGTEAQWLASLVGSQGETGPAGQQGIQGIQGIQGPQGAQGEVGPTGPAGPEGPQGPQGTGITIKGSVANAIDLPSSGNSAGDAYIVDSEGDLYVWTGTTWDNVGQIVGPQGPQGETGPAGQQGTQGIQGIQGPQGVQGPAGTNGVDGKSAYEVAVDNGFVGTEAQWLASLIGSAALSMSTSGLIETPKVKGYVLIQAAPTSGTIVSFKAQTAAGSCTVKLVKNNIDIPSSTLTIDSLNEAVLTLSTSLAEDDNLALVITATNLAEDLSFTLKIN
jgi:hypothetical protein